MSGARVLHDPRPARQRRELDRADRRGALRRLAHPARLGLNPEPCACSSWPGASASTRVQHLPRARARAPATVEPFVRDRRGRDGAEQAADRRVSGWPAGMAFTAVADAPVEVTVLEDPVPADGCDATDIAGAQIFMITAIGIDQRRVTSARTGVRSRRRRPGLITRGGFVARARRTTTNPEQALLDVAVEVDGTVAGRGRRGRSARPRASPSADSCSSPGLSGVYDEISCICTVSRQADDAALALAAVEASRRR